MEKTGMLLGLAMLVVGCGEGIATSPQMAGVWEYSWQNSPTTAVHGIMLLEQTGPSVTGTLGFPADYPNATDAIRGAWACTVSGAVDVDSVELYASGGLDASDWWFDVTVLGNEMVGPEYEGPQRMIRYAFSAARQP